MPRPVIAPDSATAQFASLLRDAEAALALLDKLSVQLSRVAPHEETFFAVNRAWREANRAVDELHRLSKP